MPPSGDETSRDTRGERSSTSPQHSAVVEELRPHAAPQSRGDDLTLEVVRDALREATSHLGGIIKSRAWPKTGLRQGRALLKRVWTWERASETEPDGAATLGAALAREVNALLRAHGSPVVAPLQGEAMDAAWCQALASRHGQWRALTVRATRPSALLTRLLRAEDDSERRVERVQRFLALFGLKLEGMARRRRGPPALPASWGDDEHEALTIVEKQGRQ